MENTNYNNPGIAARIVYLRTKILQMTQSQFASLLKISQTYLSLVENGKKQVSDSLIQLLIITFSVNFEWLVYGLGNDDDIFFPNNTTKEYLKSCVQSDALSTLQTAYSLNAAETDYVAWFLSLTHESRKQYMNALKAIADMSK